MPLLFVFYIMKSIVNYLVIAILSVNVAHAMQNETECSPAFFTQANSFFSQYVSNGKVDYKAIKANPTLLNELVKTASTKVVDKSDKATYQAFWINAYNITVIKSIVANYPIKFPLDKAGFFDKTKHTIANQSLTLNDIENTILRAQFKDPRFHFVLVCGATSCPPIISEAYMPATLDQQMTKQTSLALNGTYFITVDSKKKRVVASKIMSWYNDDFKMNGSTEIDFINTYRKEKIPTDYKIIYSEYNWSLNIK